MYRWVDHTAELELEIEATTEPVVFAEALAALGELLLEAGAEATRDHHTRRSVAAAAPDRPALLAAWLEELVFLAETQGFVATELERLELSADALQAAVGGVVADPPPLVKAVTYHRLLFEPSGNGYVGRVVLDV